jgi:hypothetical protein
VKRSLRTRLAAFLAAAVFLLSGAGDAFGAHPCPHHAAIGAPEHAAAQAHTASAADAHHEHGAHHAAPDPSAGHDGHAACTCEGVCPVSGGPAPLAAPVLIHLPLLAIAAAPAARTSEAALPSRLVPHFLPFAQAPPRQA